MPRYILICVIAFLAACTTGEQSRNEHGSAYTEPRQEPPGRNEFVIFLYHRFGDSRYLSTNISIDDFRHQMAYLREEGFEVVTLGEALQKPYSEGVKRAVITVDDSYRSFVTGALPVLHEFGFPATLFVNTETVGGEDFLSWEQLDSVRQLGIEIGNHSHSHAYFLNMNPQVYKQRFRQDVSTSQQLFREHLGIEPDLFAYPYGEYDPELKEIVKAMGFRAAAAQNSGVVLEGQDVYALPRFPMSDTYSDPEGFREKANARALHVEYESPESPVIRPGSVPAWKLVTTEKLPRGKVQCFVQGGFCRMDSSGDTLIIQSEGPPGGRRFLYTVTMSDGDGNWYWRSHLWIRPD